MPDSRSTDQPAKPETPAPIPSPPLPPNFQPGSGKSSSGKPRASTPAPVPSPPLPPLTSKAPQPASPKPEPAEFKLSGGAPPAANEAPAAAPAAAPTASPTPAQPTPAQAGANTAQSAGAPAARAVARPAVAARPSGGSTPAAPGRTPAVPRPAHLQSMHVEEEAPEPIHHSTDTWSTWLEKVEPVAMWMFRVGAFFGAVTLAFLLYAIFVGKIGQTQPPAAMVGYIKTATTIFQYSALLLALSTVLLAFDATGLGIGLAIGGILLHFGTPWVFSNYVGQSAAALIIVNGLRATGSWLTIVGVFRAALDVARWIMFLPERMKQRADVGVGRKAEAAQQRVARDANVFSPCWKLPFCRETIRKQCPAFLARQTCWKFGRGCYCDEEMISRIIRGESLDVIKAPTRLSRTGKAPCGRCHIYLEHQGHKFRALSPLTLPATAVIMYIIWPFWTKLFSAFSNSPIWDTLSFNPRKFAPDAIATTETVSGGLPPEQVMYVATILFGVLLGFFILIYVAKFIEWFVYKAKL